jgi:hypothetical protein
MNPKVRVLLSIDTFFSLVRLSLFFESKMRNIFYGFIALGGALVVSAQKGEWDSFSV